MSPNATIIAFGDSLTSGSGASKGQDYPNILAQLTGHKVVNAGIPGEISSEGLKRLPRVLDEYAPELMVLVHGGNDFLRKLDLQRTKRHLNEMIRLARTRKISVVMLAVPQPGLFPRSPDLYAELAAKWKLPLDDDVLPDILSDNRMKSDLIHPNDKGYDRIAESVYQLIKEHGAL